MVLGDGGSDTAGFWKTLKTDGQVRGDGCSEGLRIGISEEETEGMRSARKGISPGWQEAS